MKIKLLGIDPSLNNLGLAFADYDVDSGELSITGLKLVTTDSASGKTVRKSSDDLRRARLLYEGMNDACDGISIVCAEVPVGSQSARAMASYGICVGVLAGCTLPFIEVSPNETKMAAVGIRTATKGEMIEWAMKKYPKAGWLTRKSKGVAVPTNANEHLADAVAAIVAGTRTHEFRAAMKFYAASSKSVTAD